MASSSKKWRGDSSDPDYVPTRRSTKPKSNKTNRKKKHQQKPTPTRTNYTYTKVVEPDAEFILISQSDRRDDKWAYLRNCKNCDGPFFAQMNYTPSQHFVGWKYSLMSICHKCTVEFESRSAESEPEPPPPVINTIQEQSKEDSDSDTDTVPGSRLPPPSEKRKGATQSSSSSSVSVLHHTNKRKAETTAKSATISNKQAVTEENGKEQERERAAYYNYTILSTNSASPPALPKEVHFQSIYQKEPEAALMTKNNLSDTEDSDDSEFQMAEIFSSKFRYLLHFAEMLIEAWDLRQIITEQQDNEE